MRRISTLQVLGLGLVAASCALSSAALAGGTKGGHRGHHGVRVYQGAVAPKVQVFHHRHQGHHAHQGHHGYHQGGYRYAPYVAGAYAGYGAYEPGVNVVYNSPASAYGAGYVAPTYYAAPTSYERSYQVPVTVYRPSAKIIEVPVVSYKRVKQVQMVPTTEYRTIRKRCRCD